MRSLIFASVVSTAIMFSGCSSKSPYNESISTLKSKHNSLPSWVNIESTNTAVGSSTYKGQSYGFQKNEAIAIAKMNLSNKIAAKTDSLIKTFYQATGAKQGKKSIAQIDELTKQISTQVSSTIISGVEVKDVYIAEDGEMFVKILVSEEDLQSAILHSLLGNKIMKSELNAEKGFKELKDAVKEANIN
jgi:outer membrane murein-binding lipoprotein Lpp